MALVSCGNGVRLERALKCNMSDGTVLVSDHYYPPGSGPWPTLFMRQPYGRDIASTVVYAHPVWYARQGYHVAIQDVRGRGGSTGEFYPFRYEARDGAEAIRWLCAHPACNGRIGMYGFSYQGATQLLAAVEQPRGLQCIAPHMTATDLYHGWFYHHGALRLNSTLGWGIQMLREDARRIGSQEASSRLENAWRNLRAQAQAAPYAAHPACTDPSLPSYLRDWISHRQPDDYWTAQDLSSRYDRILIPALHLAGWFDTYLEGSISAYESLRTRAGSESARDNQFLIAGPWVHIPWGDQAGEVNFGDAANLNIDSILLRWFNHWLKDTGDFDGESRVRYFALGPNEWHQTAEWYPSAECALYLHSNGNSNSRKGDGRLSLEPPGREEPRDVFVYDPEVPVVAPGGLQAVSGPIDQAVLELGNNLLVYTSPPAIRDMEVLGRPQVRIHAQTSSEYADFVAKLVRVLPNGRAEFLCIGIARSSWLFGDGNYTSDNVHEWIFALEPIAFVLQKDECLRMEISSSAFPLYDRNPGTAISPDMADESSWSRSTQQVLHGPNHLSMLSLPIKEGTAW
ncbi:CocE/NonD family hydrolase [Acidobacteria bacterium AB60]|nr:CocE/NonD family hydrolase [Acidobacteria bacterium AB60]